MTATRQDIIDHLRQIRRDIDDIVERAPATAWSAPMYENTWTAREVLSHVVSTSGVCNFVMMMAQLPADAAGGGSDFDQHAFNAQQVALRAERSIDDLADEMRANLQRDTRAVEQADDALLAKHFVASWGDEGSVAQVICNSLKGHLGEHLADIRTALGV